MKIFVGYHFDVQDQWVKDLVYPIIKAFGAELITGESLYGEGSLGPSITSRIKQCDALIGFATRRNKIDDHRYTTHRWVTDEISQALGFRTLKVLEVREDNIDAQFGMSEGCQYIKYNEAKRERCLIELIQAIGEWHRGRVFRIQLLPEEAARSIALMLDDKQLRCSYQLYEKTEDEPGEERKLKVVALQGGLFANVRDVPEEAFIRIRVECGAKRWVSDFESTGHYGIRLKEA